MAGHNRGFTCGATRVRTIAKAVWPAFQSFSAADVSLRPLAIARTFLAHRLDVRLGIKAMSSDAFGYASDLAMWGPASQALPRISASISAYLMNDARSAAQRFGFEGWSQYAGVHVALLGSLAPKPLSARGLPFRVVFDSL